MFWFKKQQKYIRLAHKQILLNYIFQVTSLTFYILNLLMSCHTIQFYNLFWSEVGFKVFSTSTSQIPTNKNAVQFSSVAQSCPTLCDPMDYSIPGFPVLHCLSEFARSHVHWVDNPPNGLILCGPLLLLPSILIPVQSTILNSFCLMCSLVCSAHGHHNKILSPAVYTQPVCSRYASLHQ